MSEDINRAAINAHMNNFGIRSKNRVWKFINEGQHSQAEVYSLILQIRDEQDAEDNRPTIKLGNPIQYRIFGKSIIEQVALDDMAAIARLPYVKSAAQMPDSHRVKEGHVPVGGVIVTNDCVLPGVVGNDIACSVASSITDFPVTPQWFFDNSKAILYFLDRITYFGLQQNKELLDDNMYYQKVLAKASDTNQSLRHDESIILLRGLTQTIRNHFGTSGDGNHFIEIGWSNLTPKIMGTRGKIIYGHAEDHRNLAILSHFGSRGLGSNIADFYLRKANEINPVPKGMEDNAPLFFGTDMWAEDYWMLMELCGEFAKQGHAYIHDRLRQAIMLHDMDRARIITAGFIHTTHNYAWTEDIGFVHRKGATPAHSGQYANIPATMGDQSRIVVGLGNPDYLDSASHGAGRAMSRSVALKQGWENVAEYVHNNYGVTLIGGGSDEDPRSYKRIENVMRYQEESVKEIGQFTPLYCRMAAPKPNYRKRKVIS